MLFITSKFVLYQIRRQNTSFPASGYGPLYHRNIEYGKIHTFSINQGNYNAHTTLSDRTKDDLHWWLENLSDMHKANSAFTLFKRFQFRCIKI